MFYWKSFASLFCDINNFINIYGGSEIGDSFTLSIWQHQKLRIWKCRICKLFFFPKICFTMRAFEIHLTQIKFRRRVTNEFLVIRCIFGLQVFVLVSFTTYLLKNKISGRQCKSEWVYLIELYFWYYFEWKEKQGIFLAKR